MPAVNKFKRFNVRPLLEAGEEPFSKILARVQALTTNEGLIVIAPFLPSPLIDRLAGEGFASKVEHDISGEWLVYFWRRDE